MLFPAPPAFRRIEHITLSVYLAALQCASRAAWLVGGDKAALPTHPSALLGSAFHELMRRARNGAYPGRTENERIAEAEVDFDGILQVLFDDAHPYVRMRFEAPERLPYYHLIRARAGYRAADIARRRSAVSLSKPPKGWSGPSTEVLLTSRDGRIVGRLDYIDVSDGTVYDYKLRSPSFHGEMSEREMRQLRLYAFLAIENGVPIERGVVERVDGTRAVLQISPQEAIREGQHALAVLDDLNARVDDPFESAATPSADNCSFCPCIPFCEPFWQSARPFWGSLLGFHVEGEVVSYSGEAMVSIQLQVDRGTGPRGRAICTGVPRVWLSDVRSDRDGVDRPLLRITGLHLMHSTGSSTTYRADIAATAIWTS